MVERCGLWVVRSMGAQSEIHFPAAMASGHGFRPLFPACFDFEGATLGVDGFVHPIRRSG